MSYNQLCLRLEHITFSHIYGYSITSEYNRIINDFCSRDYELFFLKEGNAKLNICEKTYYLYPNDIAIIKPFELHSFAIDEKETSEFIHIRINACCLSELDSRLIEMKNVYCFPDFVLNNELRNFEQLISVCPHNMKDVAACSFVLNFLSDLCCCGTLKQCIPVSVNRQMAAVIRFIYDNYSTITSIDSLSSAVSVNKEKIRRFFLIRMNVHTMDFIKRLRLIAAEDWLSCGESVYVVLKKAGFKAYSTFLRAYTNRYNRLPSKHVSREDLYPLVRNLP